MDPFDPHALSGEEPEEPAEEDSLPESPIEAPVAPSSRAKLKARSKADELLDKIEGIEHAAATWNCKHCGCDRFRTITPLGAGVTLRQCRGCGKRFPRASVGNRTPDRSQHAHLVGDSGQLPTGPFQGAPLSAPNPLRPMHRIKTERGE